MAKAAAKRSIFAISMALFCGVAIGLIVAMLPLGLLESLVEQTGLSSVLAAAAPPLGGTARAMLAGTAGLAMAVPTFVLLRALEGLPPIRVRVPRPKRDADAAIFAQSAVQAQGPIMAARDLGVPFDSITAEPTGEEPAAPAEDAPILELTEPVAPDMLAPPEPVNVVQPQVVIPEWRPGAEPEPIAVLPARTEIDGDIPALVRRLEAGFDRRAADRDLAVPVAPQGEATQSAPPAESPAEPDIDLALRNALGTLQRMTARAR
jgi:hypothetical protein